MALTTSRLRKYKNISTMNYFDLRDSGKIRQLLEGRWLGADSVRDIGGKSPPHYCPGQDRRHCDEMQMIHSGGIQKKFKKCGTFYTMVDFPPVVKCGKNLLWKMDQFWPLPSVWKIPHLLNFFLNHSLRYGTWKWDVGKEQSLKSDTYKYHISLFLFKVLPAKRLRSIEILKYCIRNIFCWITKSFLFLNIEK